MMVSLRQRRQRQLGGAPTMSVSRAIGGGLAPATPVTAVPVAVGTVTSATPYGSNY